MLSAILSKLAQPAIRFAVGLVFKEVFKAEKLFGSGRGAEKLQTVVEAILKSFDADGVEVEPDEIIKVVNAVVQLLNTIGMFDDEPGLKFDSITAIIDEVIAIVEAIADLLD